MSEPTAQTAPTTPDTPATEADFAPGAVHVEDPAQPSAADEASQLKAQIDEVRARAAAELYNVQKRLERDVDNARKYALEKFAGSLLEVVDNLERALAAGGEDSNPVLEGVRLTHKSLLTVLEKHGVQVVDPHQQEFNADLHQAVGIHPEAPANQVGQVLQKGYTLNGRLLRPAMVMVGQ
jgi:molecular chaperone GrpE